MPLSTSGIGSLPHTEPGPALELALRVDLPYLPQLPRRAATEYMIPQALEGLPGLRVAANGAASVERAAWKRDAQAFEERLERALDSGELSGFEPSPDSCCAWRPFLLEIGRRGLGFAKVQLAGPLAARWGVGLDDPRLARQIARLVLARARAMARAVAACGARPILFLDEPVLGLLAPERELVHGQLLEELRELVLALKREGALVGLHCCADADWRLAVGLGLDLLSFDQALSFESLLARPGLLQELAASGTALALGIVPTAAGQRYDLSSLVARAAGALELPGAPPALLLTPACGLGMREVAEAERVFGELREAQRLMRRGAEGQSSSLSPARL